MNTNIELLNATFTEDLSVEDILTIDGGNWRCVLGVGGGGFIAGLGGAAAYAALASNPVGWAVGGVIAIGVISGGATDAAGFC